MAVAAGQHRRHDVRHHPQHQHLAFRIAEADIVFEQFGSLGCEHHAGIQHAAERRAARLHAGHGRNDDLRHDLGVNVRCHEWRRRIGAHAAGVRPLVVIEHPLVVLRGCQRDGGLAVGQGEKADLATGQEFLDHDFGAGRAEPAVEHHGDGGFGFIKRLGDDNAFAGGQAIRLDHDRRALLAHIGQRIVRRRRHC